MVIAIDARMYGTSQRGIGRYLMKLIEHLEQIVPSPPPSPARGEGDFPAFTIFLRRANWDEYQPRNPNFRKVLWDVPWYGLREQLQFRQLFQKKSVRGKAHDRELFHAPPKIDLYHFPHWNVPLLFKRPFVMTIHDLELFSSNRTRGSSTRGRAMYWFKHLAFRAVFRHAVLASRAIIVPSNAVREQLLDKYPQVRKKVYVIYEAPTVLAIGYSLLDISKTNSAPPKAAQISNSKYLLYVGSAYPHKNLPRLLEAWQIVHQELPEYKLVLVGREDWFWERLRQQFVISTKRAERARGEISSARNMHGEEIPRGVYPAPPPLADGAVARNDEKEGVLFYGEATDTELAALYAHAALLVQPSLEEGFSLPPLEALAHGCPVAVSNIPVHREILSEAAFYFDPRDVQAIAVNVKEALTNSVARNTRVMHGQALLPRYAWTNHAQQTLGVYLRAL